MCSSIHGRLGIEQKAAELPIIYSLVHTLTMMPHTLMLVVTAQLLAVLDAATMQRDTGEGIHVLATAVIEHAPAASPPATEKERRAFIMLAPPIRTSVSETIDVAAAPSFPAATILLRQQETPPPSTDASQVTELKPGNPEEVNRKDLGLVPGRASARRLTLLRALFLTAAHYFFQPEARRAMKSVGHKVVETVKGIPTTDFDLNYYQHTESCLTAIDIVNDWYMLGLVPYESIKVKYLPAQHRGILEYEERRRSKLEVLKPAQHHLQTFLLPHGCVAKTNSTWVAYCTTQKPPCYVGRIDIHTSAADINEKPVPLHPIDNKEFSERLLAQAWESFDVLDVFEGIPEYNKPVTMLWDKHCIMHAYFETKAIEKTLYFWMKDRQAFQMSMEQTNGTPYRKMSAFPFSCGGRSAEDFIVTVKELEPPGNYKAIMKTLMYSESATEEPDQIELREKKPLRPLEDWDAEEEELDFVELFPDAQGIPLLDLESGPYD